MSKSRKIRTRKDSTRTWPKYPPCLRKPYQRHQMVKNWNSNLTKLIWTPRLRWVAEQSMQRKTPYVTDAHVGFFALQSKHTYTQRSTQTTFPIHQRGEREREKPNLVLRFGFQFSEYNVLVGEILGRSHQQQITLSTTKWDKFLKSMQSKNIVFFFEFPLSFSSNQIWWEHFDLTVLPLTRLRQLRKGKKLGDAVVKRHAVRSSISEGTWMVTDQPLLLFFHVLHSQFIFFLLIIWCRWQKKEKSSHVNIFF